MRHDDISVKIFTRELKRLARKVKPEKLLSELSDNKWDPVEMHKKGYVHAQTHQVKIDARQTST